MPTAEEGNQLRCTVSLYSLLDQNRFSSNQVNGNTVTLQCSIAFLKSYLAPIPHLYSKPGSELIILYRDRKQAEDYNHFIINDAKFEEQHHLYHRH